MSRFLRHIKEGFVGAFRHGALLFSSAFSVTITLILMAVFMLLNSNIGEITRQIEQQVSLYVQIDNEAQQDAITTLGDGIKSLPGVSNVVFSDKDAELEFLIEDGGVLAEELYGPYRGEDNPLLNAYIVNVQTGASIRTLATSILELDNVFQVRYGGDATEQFLQFLEQIRNSGFVFVIALSGIAIFLISNTISATVHSREKEISIMRTVGATNWFIRWPFIIEGMIIGMIGSIIPILITVFGYNAVYHSQTGQNLSMFFRLLAPEPVVWEVSGMVLLVGVGVGALGSLYTVSRRLRWTR